MKRYLLTFMKFFSGLVLILSLLLSCIKKPDPSLLFPQCAGIKGDFSPYHIVDPYRVKLLGEDTLDVQMIFTNYTPRSFFTYESFHLWIKSISVSGKVRYTDGYCYFGSDNKWYGNSGLYWHRRYANCDLVFDEFTCTQVSGSGELYVSQITDTSQISNPALIPETRNYNFVGSK